MGIAGLSRIIAMEGAQKGVRSNTLAPGAQTRMTARCRSRPKSRPPAAPRKQDTNLPARPAAMAVALASPLTKAHLRRDLRRRAATTSRSIPQPRPIATLSKDGGWDVGEIINEALPQWKDKMVGLARPPRPGEPASFVAQQQQQQQKAKT